ncbi:hypothetical protein [Parasediminibacterium sp. JCM 36343]|uniref:hypothetical protein n=1 Tax=Parasediminibacterium sp. JCM 36343 TaxID=3374279 RepID=UPI00397C9E68
MEFAKYVLGKAQPTAVATVLAASHNVSAADITDLSGNITSFEAIIAKPLQSKAETQAYGKMVELNLDDLDDILDKIRQDMRSYRKTNRLLFETFEATDVLDVYGKGSSTSVYSGSLNAGESKAVTTFVYASSTPVTLESTSKQAVDFQLYKKGVAVGTAFTVQGNTAATTTLGNIAADGDALFVKNNSTTGGASWKVTL